MTINIIKIANGFVIKRIGSKKERTRDFGKGKYDLSSNTFYAADVGTVGEVVARLTTLHATSENSEDDDE